ncbi:ankyrin [Penicillium hispanicum]|uniref:ankyrin n=1 Tax=Penicillium hispanicum TaxID=1080232 RepID=UPI002540BEDB|nr:ankyrin [Penicillium hispanicum]KAJ5595419.1 ankyrin [Penicillium hispanicum]
MATDENPRRALLKVMELAAHIGDVAQLQGLLHTWETQTIDGALAINKDKDWFEPTAMEQFEVFNELNRPPDHTKLVHTSWYIFNRLLVAASRGNQVAVVSFLLDRGVPITSSAVQKAIANDAFDVLEVFLGNGWDINQPIRNDLCPLLSKNKIMDVLSHAARFASPQVLEVLVSYGANFAYSNALHRAAERGRLEVMQWLLEQRAFPVNQREHEYDVELFQDRRSNGLGTALHAAVKENCAVSVDFLLKQGIDATVPDSLGHTALDRANEGAKQEIVFLLETHPSA